VNRSGIAVTRGLVLAASALVISVIGTSPTAFAAGVEVRLAPATLVVSAGQQATLQVMLSSDVPLRGAQLKVTFDPSVVRIDNVTEGPFFRRWADQNGATAHMVFPFTPNNQTGETLVGGIALFGGPAHVGASGSAPLVTIQLTGLATSAAHTTLDLGAVILADSESRKVEQIEVSGAVVAIGPAGATARPAPTPFVVTQAPSPPLREVTVSPATPLEAVVLWLRQQQAVSILGMGLIGASLLYVLIVRFAASPRTRREER
jgi:hypothetical protein